MNYTEIVLRNIENVQIEDVFYDCVYFDEKDIISSHFFDMKKNKDVSYQDIGRLKEYFFAPGTCSLYIKKAIIGIELENVLIHIACDERYGDITINFEEGQFENYNVQEITDKISKLLILLQRFCKSGKTEEIMLGYEPVDDMDMKILVISQKCIEIFNENIFNSSLAKAIYSVAKDIRE